MQGKIELKPCPVCGTAPQIKWRGIGRNPKKDGPAWYLHHVECRNIECPLAPMSKEFREEAAAVRDWNERIVREAAR